MVGCLGYNSRLGQPNLSHVPFSLLSVTFSLSKHYLARYFPWWFRSTVHTACKLCSQKCIKWLMVLEINKINCFKALRLIQLPIFPRSFTEQNFTICSYAVSFDEISTNYLIFSYIFLNIICILNMAVDQKNHLYEWKIFMVFLNLWQQRELLNWIILGILVSKYL